MNVTSRLGNIITAAKEEKDLTRQMQWQHLIDHSVFAEYEIKGKDNRLMKN